MTAHPITNCRRIRHPGGGAAVLLAILAGSTLAASAFADFSPLPFLMPDDFTSMDLVAWRVEQGRPDPHNPLVKPQMPWDGDSVFAHGTVLHDPIDGRWKAWQISTATSRPYHVGTWTADRRLTYLESDDGVHWRRPELNLVKWPGYEHTNILLDLWCSYASVNIDPRREWPYEMFIFRDPGYPGAAPTVGDLPLPVGKDRHAYGLYRYRSKNGTDWNVVEGPLDLPTGDSCYIFREDAGYVAYHKTDLPAGPGGLSTVDIADGGLRVIGRRTSPDGRVWSDPTALILTPDWRDPADTQFMELNPVRYPGGYIAVVCVYHSLTQNIDLQWAASRDGIKWWRPDRRPALPNPPLGDYGGGLIWPLRSPIPDGRNLQVYYAGTEGLHGDLFNTAKSGPRLLRDSGEAISRQSSSLPYHAAFCRATWRADRLWALAPAIGGGHVGRAVTRPLSLAGKELRVSLATRENGELRAELLDGDGRVIPGYGGDACLPLRGDLDVATVRWQQGSVMPAGSARIRFLLRQAYLYGFDERP